MNGFRRNRGSGQVAIGALAAATLAAVVAAVLSATSGGGPSRGGSPSAEATASRQSPAASLKLAAYKSAATPGFKLSMSMSEAVTTAASAGGQTFNIAINGSGSFTPASRQGAMTMSMQLPSGSGSSQRLEMDVVMDHGVEYMKLPSALAGKLPGAKPWVSLKLSQIAKAAGLPSVGSTFGDSSEMTDPGQYLDFLRATSDGSVKDLGPATVNGVQTTQYEGLLDLTKLQDVVPARDRQAAAQLASALHNKGFTTAIPVEVWIDAEHLVRRLSMTYKLELPTGGSATLDITENISDYGPQPAPTVPSASETTNLFSLLHQG